MRSPVKERPILFSAPLVRSILEGRKTVTRRLVTVPWKGSRRSLPYEPWWLDADGKLISVDGYGDEHPAESCLPGYGEPGDRLWVRETWAPWSEHLKDLGEDKALAEAKRQVPWACILYGADRAWTNIEPLRWRPSIHMPRWASRITLEVVSSRIERLHAITEEDARAEGVFPNGNHLASFSVLWDEINGERAAWVTNPWVWRIEFRRIEPARPEGT